MVIVLNEKWLEINYLENYVKDDKKIDVGKTLKKFFVPTIFAQKKLMTEDWRRHTRRHTFLSLITSHLFGGTQTHTEEPQSIEQIYKTYHTCIYTVER